MPVPDRESVTFFELEPALQSALRRGTLTAVIIQAHTDSVGAPEANRALSQRWADDLKDWMIARGVPASIIAAEGFGEDEPVFAGPDETPSAENQRIEVTFVFAE